MKLLTWNVQWFRGVDGVVDVPRVIAHARSLCDFDVLCLQEVAVHFPGLGGGDTGDQVAAVAALLPGYEVFFAPAQDYRLLSDAAQGGGAPSGPQGALAPRAAFGNLLATRLPALLVERHLLPLAHEPRTPSARRSALCALLQAPHGPVTVMTTHLEYYSAAQQAAQVQRLLAIHRENGALVDGEGERAFLGTYQSRPRTASTILCGDFNFGTDSPAYEALVQGGAPHDFCDVQAEVHPGAPRPPTFGCYDTTYVKTPFACDHVLATRDIVGRARRIAVDCATQLSDHQPVYTEWEGL